jgi:hypothetical protein
VRSTKAPTRSRNGPSPATSSARKSLADGPIVGQRYGGRTRSQTRRVGVRFWCGRRTPASNRRVLPRLVRFQDAIFHRCSAACPWPPRLPRCLRNRRSRLPLGRGRGRGADRLVLSMTKWRFRD